jgi:hypothetical protein
MLVKGFAKNVIVRVFGSKHGIFIAGYIETKARSDIRFEE